MTTTKRPSAGQPSPWATVPTTPIRLPEKFREELIAVARLLDSGLVDSANITKIILALAKDRLDRTQNPKEINGAITSLVQSIVAAKGWDLTAIELGLLVDTLERSAKEVDRIFTKKAKAEAMAAPTKKTRKPKQITNESLKP